MEILYLQLFQFNMLHIVVKKKTLLPNKQIFQVGNRPCGHKLSDFKESYLKGVLITYIKKVNYIFQKRSNLHVKTKEVIVFVLKKKEGMTLKICKDIMKLVQGNKTSKISFSFDNNFGGRCHAFLLSSRVSHLLYLKFRKPLHFCQYQEKS